MKDMFYAAIKKGATGLAVLLACGMHTAVAGPLDKTMGQYSVLPRSVSSGVEPMMMLAMSNDHQLYFKAYTDYDSVVGFEATKRYIGYFDNTRCYSYVGTKGAAGAYFKMGKLAAAGTSYCNTGTAGTLWSGNFLNWATMTRIDVLRKILYGGKRTRTNYNQTILERSYLPNDAHSFAKYYNGSDLKRLVPLSSITGGAGDGITFCNTTLHTDAKRYSYKNNNPPLMRAIRGNYSLWASGERAQCLYRDELRAGNHGVAVSNNKPAITTLFSSFGFDPAFNSPAKPTVKNDFTVKVEACPRATANNETLTGCKQYPNNSWRPIGVLHTHGEDDQVKFGLISGSYKENKTGGYLRKNVGFITDEINPNNGLFITPTNGESLIGHIDALRIAGWDFASEGYKNECDYGLSTFADGKCRDWGNPLGEIMQEAYSYFAAKNAARTYTKHTGANVIKEAGNVPAGVVKAPWNPPIKGADASKNYCAKLSVLGMNTSAQSYDNNGLKLNLATSEKSPGNGLLNNLTNEIGRLEGLYTGKFFIGGNGTDNNGLCTPKSLTALTSATGACPETPRLQGGWDIAGMAQYAFENDINSYNNLADNLGRYEVEQRVQTFGIEFAAVLPKIVVGSGTDTVTIIPACQNTRGGGSGNCAIVDFKVLSKEATSGAVYINFEDSEQGGDYDQDMHGVLKYELTSSEIKVTTNVIGESTPFPLAFGYVITGVTDPGFHAHSGINGYKGAECTGCRAANAEASKEYTLATSGEVTPLPSPLELAAKYASAAPDASYYKSENPEKLEEGLNALFGLNGPTPAASTSGVTATTGSRGANIILHTYFAAQKENNNAGVQESVTWFGSIGALFIDAEGRLREDTDGNGRLTDTDRIVKFNGDYDVRGQAQVSYETLAGVVVDKQPLEDISYVWSAADRLDEVANYTTQSPAYNSASAGIGERFIYTRIPDSYADTNVVSGDLQPFVADLFNGGNINKAPLLGPVANTDDLVNYIRGEEGIAGMRNRTLTQAGTPKKYLLGDILGSSPVIASTPDYSYDDEFGDTEYAAYKAKYRNERQVVYAAANDGMIHAFDAGTFDFATKQYSGNLGAELWAYIPFNVLPHLQWLSNPGYTHVPYVDGFLGTFDVKVFPDDAVHVGGWGTILVAGTGQGGGHFPIDTDGDGNADVTTRPAYVILDVTDRNGPPKLMGEITHDELGFTVGEPDVIRYVDKATKVSSWHLVFGSGPRGYDDTSRRSAQLDYEITPNAALNNNQRRARLFSLHLTPTIKNNALKTGSITNAALDSFVGGINGMDWNRDYKDDAIYFGLIEGTGQNPDGKLMRATLNFIGTNQVGITSSVMLNTNKPVIGRPTTLLDADKNYWVFAGTGRYYTSKEGDYTHDGNVYVGIKEAKGLDETPPRAAGTVTNKTFLLGDLFNTAGIQVYQDRSIENATFIDGTTAMTSIEELRDVIANGDTTRVTPVEYDGWQIKLDSNERQLAEAAYSTGVLFFNSVLANPVANQQSSCDVSAAGYSYEIDFLSGVASPRSGNTNNMTKKDANGKDVAGVSPKTPSGGSSPPVDPVSRYKTDPDAGLEKTPGLLDPKGSSRYSWREIPLPF